MNMRRSDADALFKSKAFEDWQKGRDGEVKIQLGIVEHLGALIKSIHAIGKRR